MASEIKPFDGSAGNGSATTVYTCPSGKTAIVENMVAYNSTGGALTLTVTVVNQTGTTSTILVQSINAGATLQMIKGSTTPCFPQGLVPGETVKCEGSGAGITVRGTALQFS